MKLIDNSDLSKILNYTQSLNICDEIGLTDLIKAALNNNPYEKKTNEYILWKEQCIVNFPLLYLASIYLYLFALENGINTFLFTTRDCCHWYRIFQKLFPQFNIYYFNCSRNMLDSAVSQTNFYYDEYVKSLVGTDLSKVIYIDVHGSAMRMFNYFNEKFGDVPFGFLLSSRFKNYSEFPDITHKFYKAGKFINLVFDVRGSPCESLNYDIIGTLQDYTDNGPIRDNLEYSIKLIEPYHKCMNYLISKTNPLMINNYDQYSNLSRIINKIFKFIKNTKPTILKYIKHMRKHKKQNIKKNLSTDFDKIIFFDVISDDTVYSIVWDGMYNGIPCVIKMITLKTGLYYDMNNKNYFIKSQKVNRSKAEPLFINENKPFYHSDFKIHKAMNAESFNTEVNNLIKLSSLNLAPKYYGHCIVNKNGIDYGFIMMEKADFSLKQILLERSLYKFELQIVEEAIENLHNNGIIHGDLKPSNICTFLNRDGFIERVVFIDCQKIKQGDTNTESFRRIVSNNLIRFAEHFKKNINERDQSFKSRF